MLKAWWNIYANDGKLEISPHGIIKEEIFIVLKWNGMPPYCDIFTCTCYQNKL